MEIIIKIIMSLLFIYSIICIALYLILPRFGVKAKLDGFWFVVYCIIALISVSYLILN